MICCAEVKIVANGRKVGRGQSTVGSRGEGGEVGSSQLAVASCLVKKILEMKFCVGGNLGSECFTGFENLSDAVIALLWFIENMDAGCHRVDDPVFDNAGLCVEQTLLLQVVSETAVGDFNGKLYV